MERGANGLGRMWAEFRSSAWRDCDEGRRKVGRIPLMCMKWQLDKGKQTEQDLLSYIMPTDRVKCVGGINCPGRTRSVKRKEDGSEAVYWSGRNISAHQRIKCSDCDTYACFDSVRCISALNHHYNLAHVCGPYHDLTIRQQHSLAHALTFHFGLDGGLDVARANHAIISSCPDGIDATVAGQSDNYNSRCVVCNSILGAFAFKEGAELVCFPCARDKDPNVVLGTESNTVRLWSQR
jgi:hypothetical protein